MLTFKKIRNLTVYMIDDSERGYVGLLEQAISGNWMVNFFTNRNLELSVGHETVSAAKKAADQLWRTK